MKATILPSPVEFDWLLACLRHAMGKGALSENVPAGVDWTRFVEAARWHEVAPILGGALGDALPDHIPAEVCEALSVEHAVNSPRVQSLSTELVAVTGQLRKAGVPALPIKGPLLAALYYPKAEWRQCTNLDFLIQPGHLRLAAEVLTRRGYRFDPFTETLDETAQWHIESFAQFRHPASDAKVCLHSQIVPRRYGYRVAFEPLWQRARVKSLPAGRLVSLSPEDWLIVLCLHAIKNGFWPRLKLACDLARVLTVATEIDWRYVREESQRLGCERVVLLGLGLASELLGAEVPHDWLEAIRADAVAKRLHGRVRRRLASCETGFGSLGEAIRTHVTMSRRPLDKLRYGLAMMTTPSERDFQFFGRSVSVPGSYAVHGLKLASKCLGQLASAARRRAVSATVGSCRN